MDLLKQHQRGARREAGFWLMSLLFLISGATSLTYELVWIKRFTHIWGSSSLAMATVVACFLLGLGLGARFCGGLADQTRSPLRWYGLAEIAIGVLALLVPWELALLTRVAGSIEGSLPDLSAFRLALRFATTFLIVGPPSILMGGTLPLLIRQGTTRSLSDATGWLYGLNTFGAALGCYLAGFHIVPALGLFWANALTAGVNLAIGGGAIVLARRLPEREIAPTTDTVAEESAPAEGRGRLWLVLIASALTGCAALVLQMAWARQLAVTLGGSTYGYSATLFTVLVGIAVGGLLFHLFLRNSRHSEAAVAVIVALISAFAVIGQQRIAWLCDMVALNHDARATLIGNAWVCVLTSAVLELLPSIGAGLLFPLLVQLTRRGAGQVGEIVGSVYLWNTLGSIVGAGLTALLLFPLIGTAGAVALAIGLYIATVLLVCPPRAFARPAILWGSLAGSALCAGLVVGWPIPGTGPADPRLTNYGNYLYGYMSVERRLDTGEVKFFEEGVSSNVMVLEVGPNRTLRVNGKVDAGTSADMGTQLGLAYMPQAFHPAGKDVLVIGYGSGASVGASLQFPENRVVCCEIEPAIHRASQFFHKVNHAPEKSGRLEMVFDDGRAYMQRSDRQFDIIISEPSNPWIAGVGNLFTREFFQAARAHLRPGGVLSQWVQTYQFTVEEYAMILRTLLSVFPHCGVVTLVDGGDTIILASDRPLTFDEAAQSALAARLAKAPQSKKDLQAYFGSDDFRSILLRHFAADETGLEPLFAEAGPSVLNTDLNLRLEYNAPLRLFAPATDALRQKVMSLFTPESRVALAKSMNVPAETGFLEWSLGVHAFAQGQGDAALEHLRKAVEADPRLAGAWSDLAKGYLAAEKRGQALDALVKLLPLRPDDIELKIQTAALMANQGDPWRGVELYREALRLDPTSLSARINLAWILAVSPQEELRDPVEALKLAQEACEMSDYKDGFCLDVLSGALAANGEFARAAHMANMAMEMLAVEGRPKDLRQRIAAYSEQARATGK